MPDDAPLVRDAPEHHRYEVVVDGRVAGYSSYRPGDDLIDFTHTEIDEAYEGQGLGSVLVRGALEDARARGLAVLPHCPFVARYISRHREYVDLVPVDRRARFKLAD